MMRFFQNQIFLLSIFLVISASIEDGDNNLPYCYSSKSKNQDVPVTWKCDRSSKKCVRTITEKDDDPLSCKTSVTVCKLLCDEYGSLWPKPTGILNIEKELTSINVGDIAFVMTISDSNSELWNLLKELQNYFLEILRNSFKNKNIARGGNELKIIFDIKDEETTSFVQDANENYTLTVNIINNELVEVLIDGENFLGVRHAIETLTQLITYDLISNLVLIPKRVFISDAPFYKHRGILLDTSRSFYTVNSIKRLLDSMAYNKLNTFHWHLTDSHSFPFVSKNYPKMAVYGAYSSSQVYTWSDMIEIRNYAKIRGIRIIPELDTPAHVGEGWQFFDNEISPVILCYKSEPWRTYCIEPPCGILNPVNDEVYEILKKLYSEFNELFESDVFHMGGDEVTFACWNESESVTKWMKERNIEKTEENFIKLWSTFQSRAMNVFDETYESDKKKKIILWTSSLTEQKYVKDFLTTDRYIIQIWTKGNNKQIADLLNDGYDVILSNYDALYLDCGYGAWIGEENNWCSPYIGWQKIYMNSPEKIIDDLRSKYPITAENPLSQVLGSEAALWSEQADENSLDTRLWPRAAALGERLWTNPKTDWKVAESRFLTQRERMVSRNIACDVAEMLWCYQNEGHCY